MVYRVILTNGDTLTMDECTPDMAERRARKVHPKLKRKLIDVARIVTLVKRG